MHSTEAQPTRPRSTPHELATALARVDIDAVRADTPAAENVIHVNNAGASLPPDVVTEATIDHLRAEAEHGGYETGDARRAAVDRVYPETAAMLGCREDEIAFQPNASQAWWAAFNSVPLEAGDRILATTAEYVANGLGLIQARSRGVIVDIVPDDEHGQTSVEALDDMLDEQVKLVCVTHVPTSGGLINPVAAIGKVVKEGSDALYLVDACQSAGQLPLSVDELRCDFLSITGRKFVRAPRGTGLLYQRAGLAGLLPPRLLDGWASEWTGPWSATYAQGARVHELFECSMSAKVGLGVAIAYARDLGLENIAARVQALASGLRDDLESLDGVSVADRGVDKCGIVTFAVAGRAPSDVVAGLRQRGINSSASKVEAAQFDLSERAPQGLVRASLHYFNTTEELALVADAVGELRPG